MKRTGLLFQITLMFILPCTIICQVHLANRRFEAFYMNPDCPWCDEQQDVEDVIYLPVNTYILRLIAPADPEFIGDIIWMRTVYYFGKHALSNKNYPYLLYLLDIVTDLTFSWDVPFLFGAVLLPIEADAVEDGMYLIEKGILYHPDNWKLWFFKGYYLWQYDMDLIDAAKSLSKAALCPGAPKYLAPLSATLATQAGQNALARQFIIEALQSIEDQSHKRLLIEKLKEIELND